MGNGAICGDADGDGGPGQTTAWLNGLLGTDLVDLAGAEAIDLLIDVDPSCTLGSGQASDYEVVAGIPNTEDITAFAVNLFSQNPLDFTTLKPVTYRPRRLAALDSLAPAPRNPISSFRSTTSAPRSCPCAHRA